MLKQIPKWNPRFVTFLVCCSGIYISYLLLSIVQENLTKARFGEKQELFDNTLYLLFWQCIVNTIAAGMAIRYGGGPIDDTPFVKYFWISVSYISAMFTSNLAMQYVSFPMVTLAKSCKPIPVMVMSLLLVGRRQPLARVICVFMVTGGVALFSLSESKQHKADKSNSLFGILLLAFSLAMDGLTGPLQETVIRDYSTSPKYMMYAINAWAVLLTGSCLVVSGKGVDGTLFCMRNPAVLFQIGLFSLCSAVGQIFIHYTIFEFGALICSIVATTRKFFTILLSILFFGNELASLQWFAVFTVFSGLGIDIYASATSKSTKAPTQKKEDSEV
eukprot:TRINITY_DN3507_c0_g1_i1.p1 TRINITY_DN3507_c0_g1~~TRINITY_DN3507_c0_g1_i1.p1  ORF type:complete len:331 (-),score=66.29 TRINITY_DN3507_c0_g1_i1:29-1021(-)